jgi:hypothetical protein
MRNHELKIKGVYLSDIANALEKEGIPLTKENLLAAAESIELLASAWAKAAVQENTKEDWLNSIEVLRQ